MAGSSKESKLAQRVYISLQAASCPLVQGLYLQAADMQQLLCTPSKHRTNILAWICSSISPNFMNLNLTSLKLRDPDILNKEIAMLCQELMLCKANDLDMIRGCVTPWRQLQFLEQLLTLVPGCGGAAAAGGVEIDQLLREIFAVESVPNLTHMLKPTLDPWPAHVSALSKDQSTLFCRNGKKMISDVPGLLQSTQTALDILQSECKFLRNEDQSASVFSPATLGVAVSDLHQMTTAFSYIYEMDFRAYCSRDPPNLSTEMHIFTRLHQQLQACNMELDMLKAILQTSTTMSDSVCQIQTQPCYWRHGEKSTLSDHLEALTKQYRDFLTLLDH